jgi:hypothetical protein
MPAHAVGVAVKSRQRLRAPCRSSLPLYPIFQAPVCRRLGFRRPTATAQSTRAFGRRRRRPRGPQSERSCWNRGRPSRSWSRLRHLGLRQERLRLISQPAGPPFATPTFDPTWNGWCRRRSHCRWPPRLAGVRHGLRRAARTRAGRAGMIRAAVASGIGIPGTDATAIRVTGVTGADRACRACTTPAATSVEFIVRRSVARAISSARVLVRASGSA